MEGLASVKRRRVYSVEPNRIEEAAFARKYVSYLVPALKKMKERTAGNNYREEEESNNDSLQKVVKYEVDMALVLSAKASAWSNALKLNLQNNNEALLLSSSSSSLSSSTTAKTTQNLTAATDDKGEVDAGNEEEEEAMRRLRRLVPGGEEISNEQEMVAEFKSYVRCLQMQVNILQCLAQHPHSF